MRPLLRPDPRLVPELRSLLTPEQFSELADIATIYLSADDVFLISGDHKWITRFRAAQTILESTRRAALLALLARSQTFLDELLSSAANNPRATGDDW